MSFLSEWLRRLDYLIHRETAEEDLKREMEAHREMMGEPKSFGNTLRLREQARDVWGWNWLDDLWNDCRYGARRLLKSRKFTVFTAAVSAIGIGAATFMFGFVNLAFTPMSLTNPEELRQFDLRTGRNSGGINGSYMIPNFSYPVYESIRDNTKSFSDVLCSNTGDIIAGSGESTVRVSAQLVSGNYFRTNGVTTFIGRPITPDDDRVDAPPVVVLKYALWQRMFGGDPGVLGATMMLNGTPFTVVGVLPRGFRDAGPGGLDDLKVPIANYGILWKGRPALADPRNWRACIIRGRLKDQSLDDQATQEVDALVRQAFLASPPQDGAAVATFGLVTVPPPRTVTSDVVQGLMMVALVAAILLIELTNIIGLLLARASARRREIATCLALGARRLRILRQLLTESVLLFGIGGLLGVAFAYSLETYVKTFVAPLDVDLVLNPRVLVFTAGISILAGLAVGLVPALSATRIDLESMLKQPPRDGRSAFKAGKALVTVQVGLSLLLVISAGLFMRTQLDLSNSAQGFQTDGLLIFRVDPTISGYDSTRAQSFYKSAVERLSGVPGVSSVSPSEGDLIGGGLAFFGCMTNHGSESRTNIKAVSYSIGPRFFETMGISLRVGRDFTWEDGPGSPEVVLVNEAFVRQFYSGNPIGETMSLGPCAATVGKQASVIGVVADAGFDPALLKARPTVFLPVPQQSPRTVTITLRTGGDPVNLIPAVRQAMSELDRTVPIYELQTLNQRIEEETLFNRFIAGLLGLAGAVALLLASLGIYGALSYSVAQRTSEIGVRMALGAQNLTVIAMVVRESLIPVGIGLGGGLVAAFPLTRFLASTVFEISTNNDPLAIVAGLLCLCAAATLAAYLPARRASRIDPMSALRHE